MGKNVEKFKKLIDEKKDMGEKKFGKIITVLYLGHRKGLRTFFVTFIYFTYWEEGTFFSEIKKKRRKKYSNFWPRGSFRSKNIVFCNSLLWKRSETKLGQVETILAFDRCRSQLFPHDLFRRVIRQFEIINTRHNAGQVIVGINIGWVECFLNNC